MNWRGVVLGRPSGIQLDELLAGAERRPLSYEHVGSTLGLSRSSSRPERPLRRVTLVLGSGPDCFERAVDGLRAWACHKGIGARVHRADAPLIADTTVLVTLPAGPLSIIVPNRIVGVIDEPRRFGFAYGTIEGHHERGEESFLVEVDEAEDVRATIAVDAVPDSWPARAGNIVVSRFQSVAVDRYLHALHDSVAEKG